MATTSVNIIDPPKGDLRGGVTEGEGVAISPEGAVNLSPATTSTIGGVIVGSGLSVNDGVLSVTGGGGTGTRTTLTASVPSTQGLSVAEVDLVGFKSYALLGVNCDGPAWVRIYSDPSSRVKDRERNIMNDPYPGSGVVAEATFTSSPLPAKITPFTYGGNTENPVTDKIYLAVQNLSKTARSFTVSLTVLQLES